MSYILVSVLVRVLVSVLYPRKCPRKCPRACLPSRPRQLKDHPNIVHLLGLCDCDIVTEYFPVYMDNLILANPSSEETPEKFPDRDIIRMALDAARGLQALHELPGGPVVHADLQPRQLLLDHAKTVKVNDFNRSRFMGRDTEGKPCPFFISKGNGVWRAPEEYNGEVGNKADVICSGQCDGKSSSKQVVVC